MYAAKTVLAHTNTLKTERTSAYSHTRLRLVELGVQRFMGRGWTRRAAELEGAGDRVQDGQSTKQ